MESHKDDDVDSEIVDWGLTFMRLKNRGFSHEEILNLSYPQFNAYMNNISNPMSYNVVVPYMGSGEEVNDNKEERKVSTKEELLGIIADMNNDFN